MSGGGGLAASVDRPSTADHIAATVVPPDLQRLASDHAEALRDWYILMWNPSATTEELNEAGQAAQEASVKYVKRSKEVWKGLQRSEWRIYNAWTSQRRETIAQLRRKYRVGPANEPAKQEPPSGVQDHISATPGSNTSGGGGLTGQRPGPKNQAGTNEC